jgi:hypothetical protein
MINAIEISTIPEINLSGYAQLSDIPNLSNVAKLNEENIFTENNTFTNINANRLSSETLIIGNNNSIIRDETIENAFNGIVVIGENNIAIGKHSVAEGTNNIVGCKVC